MTKYQAKPLDFSQLKTVSLHGRGGKVRVEHFAETAAKAFALWIWMEVPR